MALKVTAHGRKVAATLTVMSKKPHLLLQWTRHPLCEYDIFPSEKKKGASPSWEPLVSLIFLFSVSFSITDDFLLLASFISSESHFDVLIFWCCISEFQPIFQQIIVHFSRLFLQSTSNNRMQVILETRIYQKRKINRRFFFKIWSLLRHSLNLLQALQGQTSSFGIGLIYIQRRGCNERQFDPGIRLRLICRPFRLHSWPSVALLRSNYEQISENWCVTR